MLACVRRHFRTEFYTPESRTESYTSVFQFFCFLSDSGFYRSKIRYPVAYCNGIGLTFWNSVGFYRLSFDSSSSRRL